MTYRVLIIEDRSTVREMIAEYLQKQSFAVVAVEHGRDAIQVVTTQYFDCVLLDLVMPVMDGLEFLQAFRRISQTPVVIISAKIDEEDKIRAFQLGADEYITKPISLRELHARLNALLRRITMQSTSNPTTPSILMIDQNNVFCHGRMVSLTKTETKILQLLMSQPNRAFSWQEISQHLYQSTYHNYDRAIDVHVFNLRNKIERDPKNPQLILTIHGLGYTFTAQP